jgi:hypothetical protein
MPYHMRRAFTPSFRPSNGEVPDGGRGSGRRRRIGMLAVLSAQIESTHGNRGDSLVGCVGTIEDYWLSPDSTYNIVLSLPTDLASSVSGLRQRRVPIESPRRNDSSKLRIPKIDRRCRENGVRARLEQLFHLLCASRSQNPKPRERHIRAPCADSTM